MPITVLIAIALLILLWLFLNRKYPTFPDRLARFWTKPKYPTKLDIAKKYPKSKSLQEQSLERKRREAREKDRLEAERKQAIIDRHIKEIRSKPSVNNWELPARRESKLEQAKRLDVLHQQFRESKPTVSHAAKRDISISKLRKLTKMVNGREDVARRLVEGNLKLFPDKPPDWACDKAISDLERDRRT